MTKFGILAGVIVMSAAGPMLSLGQAPHKNAKVVASFDDHSFAKSRRLPDSILRVLIQQKEAAYALDWSREHPRDDLNRFFRATHVNLTRGVETDWLVEGADMLTGADCNWFWLVREGPAGARVVLFYNGYTIHILNTETNGLRDLEGTWKSPNERSTSIYGFDGNRYKLVKTINMVKRRN